MKRYLLLLPLFFSCSYHQTSGIDAFIVDSYRIKEGKNAILALKGIPFSPLNPTELLEKEERIEENDILTLSSDAAELSELALQVTEGTLAIPILGDIAVHHLTLVQVKEKILACFPKNSPPQIELSFREKALHPVQLLGSIEKTFSIKPNTRLLDLLIDLHLGPEADLFHSEIQRANHSLTPDFVRLIDSKDKNQNIVLEANDQIIIPKTKKTIFLFLPDHSFLSFAAPKGYLSVKELLIQAAINPSELAAIEIVRHLPHPKIYLLNWRHILYLPDASLYLLEGDHVRLIKKTAIFRFFDWLKQS